MSHNELLLPMQDTNCFFGTDHKDLVSNMADGVTSIGCSGPVIGPDRAARAATAAYNSPLRLVDASKVPPSSVTFVVNAPWDGGSHGEVSPRTLCDSCTLCDTAEAQCLLCQNCCTVQA